MVRFFEIAVGLIEQGKLTKMGRKEGPPGRRLGTTALHCILFMSQFALCEMQEAPCGMA